MINLICLLLLLSVVYAWASLAPWSPTDLKDLERVNKIADLKSGQVFFEMGCGNGRVCSYIAKKNPSAKVIGMELAFLFYLITKIRVALLGPKNLEIIFGDALKYNISKVDVIYVYGLVRTLNKQVKEKIIKEMRPKAKLISYVFFMEEWSGKKTTHKGAGKTSSIHVYKNKKDRP